MKSMTGYGMGENTVEDKTITIEIRSINHRYCDIVTRIPRSMSYIEEKLIALIKSRVERGRIEVFVNISELSGEDTEVVVDIPLAKLYMEAVNNLESSLGLYSDVSMDRFLDFPDILKTKKKKYDEELIWNIAESALIDAIDRLDEMKLREGNILFENLSLKLEHILKVLNEIEEYKDSLVKEYKIKLKKRISEIIEDKSMLDEGRLENEVAYLADKSNIDEEVVRLNSHLDLFKEVASSDGAVGKKLDFIVQEMNRETNTIGSKASSSDITSRVVDIKSKIEEIREQVQNIE